MRTLSTGERKALYILNIIFEVEARRKIQQETLFIFDDIADSFDYRNKYAIIQYLVDIEEVPQFRQLLLTHNFDFFRTVQSRFVPYGNCLISEKTGVGVVNNQATGIKNPFINDWKNMFFSDERKRLASVNRFSEFRLIYKGEKMQISLRFHRYYIGDLILKAYTQLDLDKIYRSMFTQTGSFGNRSQPIVNTIESVADACIVDSSSTPGRLKAKLCCPLQSVSWQRSLW